MSSPRVFTTLLAVLATPAFLFAFAHEEDFAFDVSDDLEVDFDGGSSTYSTSGLWGSRETTAHVGRTFHLVVPKEAFDGEVQTYEAKRHGGKGLPAWLLFDKISGTFWGVPLIEDIGTFQVVIQPISKEKASTYQITIEVLESNSDSKNIDKCSPNEDVTLLTLLLDKNIRAIKPKQRVVAINNVAKFFGLPFSAFTLKPQLVEDDITDSSVVLAGPGNLHSRSSKLTSLLQVPVGCDGRLWESTAPMVHQLKQQARDGTIAEVLRLPLIGWRVKTETRPVIRNKRQTVDDYGSGDYDKYYDDYEEEYPDEYDDNLDVDSPPKTTVPTTTTTTTTTPASTTHHHRHRHGETKITDIVDPSVSVIRERLSHATPKVNVEEEVPLTIPTTASTTTATSTTTSTTTSTSTTTTTTQTTPVVAETTTMKTNGVIPDSPSYDEYEYSEYEDEEDDDPEESQTIIPENKIPKQTVTADSENSEAILPEITTVKTTTKEVVFETTPLTTTSTTTTQEPTTLQIIEDTETPVFIGVESIPSTVVTTTVVSTTEEQTIPPTTTPIFTTSSTTTSTTTTTTEAPTTEKSTTTTEEPTTVPEETTSVKVTTVRHVTTTPKSTTTIREVTETIEYGEKNFKPYIENRLQQKYVIAGKIFRFVVPTDTFKDTEDEYNLTLEFLDSNEQNVTENSWCQFNPLRREIYGLPLERDVSKWTYFVRATDTEGSYEQDKLNIQVQQHKLARVVNHEFSLHIRIEKHQEFPHYVDWSLKTLRALGKIYNTNMSEITVRRINTTGDLVVFTWSNDSVPTNYCPRSDIQNLYKILTANDRGDPSRELNLALAPELRVKKVLYEEIGVCEQPTNPATPPVNFSPILRNPVDHVNATIGELLVYKVKDDTFYDPEDVDPRSLNISLLTANREPIPSTNWLQFDNKNREFFGIPRKSGRTEYQLVCVDSGGLQGTDSLEVVVYPQPKKHYNVEFSMTIEIPYDTFAGKADLQKKFVEKLMEVFHEPHSNNFYFNPFKQKLDATIVSWYNKSLPIERCPNSEISRLESVMISKHDKSISHRLHSIMEPEFPVSTIKVLLIGNCKTKVQHIPPPEVIPIDESTPQSSSDEYLITFIVPVVIISIMLFIALVAACVLYRRKRTGKMNVEEDGRQSYGNKGIPVIFQEELEEKPEPGTKAPVILKDEKPPLAPPEYSKSGTVKLNDDSEPYQPPPPFTRTQDNGRQSRPKPTPTYRKPPPYVPP